MLRRKRIDGETYDKEIFDEYFEEQTVKRIKLEDGTAAEPSLCFGVDSGVYSPAADEVGISTAGVNRLTVTNNDVVSTVPLVAPSGDPTNPTYTWAGNPTTGLSSSFGGIIDFSSNGNVGFSVGDGLIESNFDTVVRSTGKIIDESTSVGTIGGAGDAALNVTGGFHVGNDSVIEDGNLIIHGSQLNALRIENDSGASTLGVQTTTQQLVVVRSNDPINPVYSFNGDLNSGMYWIDFDKVGISTGGVNRLTVANAGLTSSVPIVIPISSYIKSSENDGMLVASGSAALITNNVARITAEDTVVTVNPLLTRLGGQSFYSTNTAMGTDNTLTLTLTLSSNGPASNVHNIGLMEVITTCCNGNGGGDGTRVHKYSMRKILNGITSWFLETSGTDETTFDPPTIVVGGGGTAFEQTITITESAGANDNPTINASLRLSGHMLIDSVVVVTSTV